MWGVVFFLFKWLGEKNNKRKMFRDQLKSHKIHISVCIKFYWHTATPTGSQVAEVARLSGGTETALPATLTIFATWLFVEKFH